MSMASGAHFVGDRPCRARVQAECLEVAGDYLFVVSLLGLFVYVLGRVPVVLPTCTLVASWLLVAAAAARAAQAGRLERAR